MEPSNFINFINGKIGLSGTATIKLYQLLGMSKHEVELKLGAKTSAIISHFQSMSKPLTLDDSGGGWVPGDPSSGPDPASGASIVDDDSGDADAESYRLATRAFLKNQLGIHRSAIRAIKTYLQNQNNKAQVNQ